MTRKKKKKAPSAGSAAAFSLSSVAVLVVAAMVFSELSAGVRSFVVISQQLNWQQVNETLYKFPLTQVQCNDVDLNVAQSFQIQLADGSLLTTVFPCTPPIYPMGVQFHGVNPEDGSYNSITTCLVRNTVNFMDINASVLDVNPFREPMGRALLVYGGDDASFIPQHDPSNADDPIIIYNGTGDATHQSVFDNSQVIQCLCMQMISQITDPSRYEQCLRQPNLDAFDSIVNATANLQSRTAAYANSITTLQDLTTEAFQGLANVSMSIKNITGTLNNQISLGEAAKKTLDEQIKQTAQYVQTETQIISTQLAVIRGSSLAFASQLKLAINSTSRAEDQEFLFIVNQIVSAQNSLQAIVDDYQSKLPIFFQQIQAVGSALVDIDSIIDAFFNDNQMRRMINKALQKVLFTYENTPNSRGEILSPFLAPSELGSAPANDRFQLDQDLASINWSDDIWRAVVTIASNPVGVVTRWLWYCETNFMVFSAPLAPGAIDFTRNYLGPPGCDTTYTNPDFSKRCRCHIALEESRCTLQNVAGVPSPETLFAFMYPTDATAIDTTTGCTTVGAPFTVSSGGLDGLLLTGLSNTTSAFATMTNRGLAPYLTTQSYPNFELYKYLNGMKVAVPLESIVATESNWNVIWDEASAHNVVNMVYVYWSLLPVAWATVLPNLRFFDDLLYGVLPSNIDQEEILVQRFDAGDTNRCVRVGLMFYSDPTLTVSSLIPAPPITSIGYQVGNQTLTTSDVTISNSFAEAIFNEIDMLVWSPSRATTDWWDIPTNDISTSPFYGTRCAKASTTCAAVPEASQFRRDYWSFIAGQNFNHKLGGNVVPPYHVQLDSSPASPTYGQCLTTAAAPGGSWCLARQYFGITAFGIFNDVATLGSMAFEAKSGSYTAVLDIPIGTIITFSNVTCPLVTVLQDRSSGVANFIITVKNPSVAGGLSSHSTFQLNELGLCQWQSDPIALSGQQSTRLSRPVCPQNPASQTDPEILIASYLSGNGAGGTFIPCPGIRIPLNASLETTQGNYVGDISQNTTQVIHQNANDAILLAIRQAQYRILSASQQEMTFYAILHTSRNITLPSNVTMTNLLGPLINQTAAYAASLLASIQEVTAATDPSLTQNTTSSADVQAQYDQITSARATALALALAQIAKADAQEQTVEAEVANVAAYGKVAVANVQALGNALTGTDLPWIAAIVTGINSFSPEVQLTDQGYGALGTLIVRGGATGDGAGTANRMRNFFLGTIWGGLVNLFGPFGAPIFLIAIVMLLVASAIFFGPTCWRRCAKTALSTTWADSKEAIQFDTEATPVLLELMALRQQGPALDAHLAKQRLLPPPSFLSASSSSSSSAPIPSLPSTGSAGSAGSSAGPLSVPAPGSSTPVSVPPAGPSSTPASGIELSTHISASPEAISALAPVLFSAIGGVGRKGPTRAKSKGGKSKLKLKSK